MRHIGEEVDFHLIDGLNMFFLLCAEASEARSLVCRMTKERMINIIPPVIHVYNR